MTIQNPSTGPARSNPMRSDEAGTTQDAAQSANAGNQAPDAPEETAGDRVEISDAARSAQSESGEDAALVKRGREALQDSSLSSDRLAELQQRVENGFYSEPSSIQKVAEGLAEDIGGAA